MERKQLGTISYQCDCNENYMHCFEVKNCGIEYTLGKWMRDDHESPAYFDAEHEFYTEELPEHLKCDCYNYYFNQYVAEIAIRYWKEVHKNNP